MLIAIKILIVLCLAVIVFSVFKALFYMFRDGGQSERTLKALTRRVGLSVLLIMAVIVALAAGVIPVKLNPLGVPVPVESDEG